MNFGRKRRSEDREAEDEEGDLRNKLVKSREDTQGRYMGGDPRRQERAGNRDRQDKERYYVSIATCQVTIRGFAIIHLSTRTASHRGIKP